MHARELLAVLEGLGRPTVAVVGDFMLDSYVWGDAGRISPEAPVPVVHAGREEARAGGAGNVALNLQDLGAQALCFGATGRDRAGGELRQGLRQAGARIEGLQELEDRPTTQKIRILARSQQILRVDREQAGPLPAAAAAALLRELETAAWDAVILSDYGKGVLDPEFLRAVLRLARSRGAPALVDPKSPDFARYSGATVVTPNRSEAEAAAGRPLPDLEALGEAGETLRREHGLEALLVTLGPEGMLLLREGAPPLRVPTAARSVYDVTGAGDTVIATLALGLAAAVPWEAAVHLANRAAGLAVGRLGTATVGRAELLQDLRASGDQGKVLQAGDTEGLQAALSTCRREGLRVVFTNGCFDILHAGHVRYLQEARSLGDYLVVGLNDDASVRRLKGPERPFNPLEDRATVLAGLACVDLVVPFAEDTPEALIRRVCPDVLVKGSDWKDKGVVGADFVRSRGGEVRLVELLPGRSTSGLADRIRGRS